MKQMPKDTKNILHMKRPDATGKTVLVLGLGETGLSMVRWFSEKGTSLRIADSRLNPPGLEEAARLVKPEEIHCGEFDDALLEGVGMIAMSPGVPIADPFVRKAMASGVHVVGDIEIFAQHLSETESRAQVIAITGSNGKTTVTSMVEFLCKAVGRNAVAAGNISPAVLDVVMDRKDKQPEVWALELSSFQLETTESLRADAAVVLNISEDHLDRYAGMDEYADAKERIYHGCRVQILNRDDARCMKMIRKGKPSITFGLSMPENDADFGIEKEGGEIWLVRGRERLIKTSELQIAGLHNAANAQAALALCSATGLPMPAMLEALKRFKGLAHRVEFVTCINDVSFYDDSKGTNVGATVAALEGLGCKSVLIAGGIGKGQDFSPLKPAVMKHARAVVLIGQDAPLIEAALKECSVPVLRANDMREAVLEATRQARPKDAVLLSPACASFDMYRNYAHRAEVYVGEVLKLDKEVAWLH